MPVKLATYCFGSPRKKDEGLRIGAVRYLPRGVKKEDYSRLDYFDVWFPIVAPSKKAVDDYKKAPDNFKAWQGFSKTYTKEIEYTTDARQAVRLLSEMAKRTPIAIGCYCEDEDLCHRSILKRLIEEEAGR